MFDYITAKDNYDKSQTKIPLGEIFDFNIPNNLDQCSVRLKFTVVDVTALDDNKVTTDDVNIPTTLEAFGTADDIANILKEKFIQVDGFAVVELKITAAAVTPHDFWGNASATETIKVTMGHPLAKMKQNHKDALVDKDQQINDLKENQKQALAGKDQQIGKLQQNISELKENQGQTLADKDQQISKLQQNISELKQNQEQLEKKLLEETKAVQQNIAKIYAEVSREVSDKASFDKGIDSKLKEAYKTKYYSVQRELIDIIDDKTSQLVTALSKVRLVGKNFVANYDSILRSYLYEYDGEGKSYSDKLFKHFEEKVSKRTRKFIFDGSGRAQDFFFRTGMELDIILKVSEITEDAVRFYQANVPVVSNYVKSLDGDPSFINQYTIDPQARITLKTPFVIDKATNVMEFIEVPAGTEKIIYCDHTSGENTAGISYSSGDSRQRTKEFHESYLEHFGEYSFLPGKPGTVNMFTIAAKLKNGNITMPETFLSRTPALSGGK